MSECTTRQPSDFEVCPLAGGDFEVQQTPIVNCGDCPAVRGCLVECVKADRAPKVQIGPLGV